jgi:glycerate-2-kinase
VSGARQQLIDLYGAAVTGANVESLTADAVATVPLERRHRVWLFAFGKAANGMAAAAYTALKRGLAEVAGGVVVAPGKAESPAGTIAALVGDHPIPGRLSFDAAARVQQTIAQKRGGDLGIVLLSGGASSLIGAPLRGISEADYAMLCELLIGSGLDIARLNAVRKRFSLWGAGRMALAMAPARTFCFAVSDVPDNDLPTIGSGPCVPDPTKVQTVLETLESAGLLSKIAPSFRQYLNDVSKAIVPETPKVMHPAFAHVVARVIATNTVALNAAAAMARRAGLSTVVSEAPLTGEASAAGTMVAASLVDARERAEPGASQVFVWGGETTVKLHSNGATPPPGGRCQEFALAAAQRLAEFGERAHGITILSAGTDGRDGATDAAGAIVDSTTWSRIAAAGRDPAAALRDHESYAALSAANALFTPGQTGTNVMDVTIGLVDRRQ